MTLCLGLEISHSKQLSGAVRSLRFLCASSGSQLLNGTVPYQMIKNDESKSSAHRSDMGIRLRRGPRSSSMRKPGMTRVINHLRTETNRGHQTCQNVDTAGTYF